MTSKETAVPINLQLFADGGASAGAAPGGEAGSAGTETQGETAYSALNIPAKAKHILDKMPKAKNQRQKLRFQSLLSLRSTSRRHKSILTAGSEGG